MGSCARCGAENPAGFGFCSACGSALATRTCSSCDAPCAEGQAFCGRCGSPLGPGVATVHAPAPAERKLATVVFADVVGFTSLAERTDPEVVARIVNAAFADLAAIVASHGGTVDKYMGDSLMAVFGVPVAHDDDAYRAVAAALQMARAGGDLAFSIGVNSGEVMATTVGHGGAVTVIGDTVNVAARLEKAAGPGQVLVGPLTAELVGDRVSWGERRPLVLKGKAEPVDATEAGELRTAFEAVDGSARLPIVGRDAELDWVTSIWGRSSHEGSAALVVVHGEAGVGKTRLLDELAERFGAEGKVLRAVHPAYGATGGEHMTAQVLRQIGPTGDPALDEKVRVLTDDAAASAAMLDPSGLPEERLWAFVQLLEGHVTREQHPVAFLLDDMHHAAGTVLSFVADLAGRLARLPVLFVLAGRSEPAAWLASLPPVTTVRLAPLDRRASAAMASALVPGPPVSDDAAAFLHRRSGGNPLHLRELVRHAVATAAVVPDGDRSTLDAAVATAVPASVKALLGARLDALGPERKALLQRVALVRTPARREELAALGDAPAAMLDGLVAAGLLRSSRDGLVEVVDPLLGEVAYEALPRTVRAEMHRTVATVATRADDRARHLASAAANAPDDQALAAEAAGALVEVGRTLARSWRLPEARRTLGRAVQLGVSDPELLVELARLHEAAGDVSAASAVLDHLVTDDEWWHIERDHMRARLRMFTEPEAAQPELLVVAERWASIGDRLKHAWALANAGMASFNAGRMHEAARQFDVALGEFEALGDRAGRLAVASTLSLARPDDPRVPGWLHDTLDWAAHTGHRGRELSAMITLMWRETLAGVLGSAEDMAGAEVHARRVIELSEQLGGGSAVQALALLAIAARLTGRLDAASAHVRTLDELDPREEPTLVAAARFVVRSAGAAAAREALPDCPAPDIPAGPVAAVAASLVCAELVLTGRYAEAVEWSDRADRQLVLRGCGALPALALAAAGRPGDARAWAAEAEAVARGDGSAPLQRVAAAVAAELGGTVPLAPGDGVSVATAIEWHAAAAAGVPGAAGELARLSDALAAPGLARIDQGLSPV